MNLWSLVFIGDFNDLLSQQEKRGGQPHPRWACRGFSEAIQDCELVELGFYGHPFTWERRVEGVALVEEKFDRALGCPRWCEIFPDARVENLAASGSDHSPILLKVIKMIYRPVENRFRFENSWLRESDCKEVVESAWSSATNVDIQKNIEVCRNRLAEWGENLGRCLKNRIKRCRDELYGLRNCSSQPDRQRLIGIENEYEKLLMEQEDFWRQQAKHHWLTYSDTNSKYFHVATTSRKKKNSFMQL